MGDDFVDDWSKQTVSIKVDADVTTTARLVEERLGIVLTEDGAQRFHGLDASGATVFVSANTRDFPSFLNDEQKASEEAAMGPEPTSIYVRDTAVGPTIIEALSGPPFRLHFLAPYADAQYLRREAAWERVLAELHKQGWQVWLTIDGPPVVLQGHLPTGGEFELKCRGKRCLFQVDLGPGGRRWCDLSYEHAGSIEPDEAVRVLHELHAVWLTR